MAKTVKKKCNYIGLNEIQYNLSVKLKFSNIRDYNDVILRVCQVTKLKSMCRPKT